MVISMIFSWRLLLICEHLPSREVLAPLDLLSVGPTTIPATKGGGVPLHRTLTAVSQKARIVVQVILVAVEDPAPTDTSAGVMMEVAKFCQEAHLIEPYLLVKLRLQVLVHNPTLIVGLLQVIIASIPKMLPFLNMGSMDVACRKVPKRCRQVQRLDIIWEGQLRFNKILHSRAP